MAEKGLREWVKEKWVDIGAPKKNGKYQPCGRSKGSKRKYPKCVPLAKATRMSSSQKASAVKRKRAAGNPGGKPTNVATLVGLGPLLDTARFRLTALAFCPFDIRVAFASGTHFGYFLFEPLLLPHG